MTAELTTPPAEKSAPAAHRARLSGPRRFLGGFGAALGLDAKEPPADPTASDRGTRLAMKRTELAIGRTYWAAERTLMGWIRTALSMISFGFTIGKLGQVLQQVEVRKVLGGVREISVASIAYLLVVLGTVALLAAAVQYSRIVHDLREQGLRPTPSIAFVVAMVLSVGGGFAFAALVLKL